MSLRSRIRGGQEYLPDRGATAAQFLTLRLILIGSTHVGCDDSDGPGHAPQYLDVRPMNTKYRFEFSAGVLGCLIWPFLFGYILADNEWGKWGIHCGLLVMIIVMFPVVNYAEVLYKYIARGSWILAFASLFPVIPVFLGGLLIGLARRVFNVVSHVDEGPQLNFPIAFTVTILYSVTYIIGALIIGWIVYKVINRNGSNQSVQGARD